MYCILNFVQYNKNDCHISLTVSITYKYIIRYTQHSLQTFFIDDPYFNDKILLINQDATFCKTVCRLFNGVGQVTY